jgi:hypothetical protein
MGRIKVALATINDVELKPVGVVAAAIWLPIAALYKVSLRTRQDEPPALDKVSPPLSTR